MRKVLLIGACALLASTAANATNNSGTFYDGDGSSYGVSFSSNTSDNFGDDANSAVTAQFTLTGNVDKTCAIGGVDGFGGTTSGLNATVDLGTIGISAGDDQSYDSLFTMTGPATVQLNSAAAGCNYNNTLSLTKSSADGLVNSNPGSYDSSQFQANIPYAATATFTGVQSGTGTGTTQTVTVDTASAANSGTFGAWRSPLQIDVNAPQVTGKGLVGGTYSGTLTVTLAIS